MTSINPSTRSFPAPPIDLTDCDREPIHMPGSIQSHGALLVLDPTRLTIKLVAGDTNGLLGHAPEALLGRPLVKLLSPARVKSLRALLAQGDLTTPQHALDPDLR